MRNPPPRAPRSAARPAATRAHGFAAKLSLATATATALAALALAACSSPKPAPEGPTGPGARENLPSSMGPLSEAEFKAMHTPPSGEVPPRKGASIEVAGTRAYLSLPPGEGPFPAIVVIHEWWGLNPNIEHWTDRLASAGWAALAIDLYGGVTATDRDTALAALKAVEPAKASATIKAGLDFLANDARIRAPKRAVIGWCFGGGWSLQTALAHPELDGAIVYYGQLETDAAKLAAIKARVLGVFGTRDAGIPNETVDQFEAALQQAGVRAEIKRYDADHAFANPSNPKYDETSAGDAWQHVLAFLESLRSS